MDERGNARVFISWSGLESRAIALVWRDLIKETFDQLDAFVSHADIEAGERSLQVIEKELEGATVGIAVVTTDNLHADWICFETGALSKQVDDAKARVIPCLVDFEDAAQLTGPMAQFHAKKLDRDGVSSILKTVARVNGVDWQRKEPGFEERWPTFETRFTSARDAKPTKERRKSRTDKEMLSELVNLTRDISTRLDSRNSVNNSVFSEIEVDFIRARSELRDYKTSVTGHSKGFPMLTTHTKRLFLITTGEWMEANAEYLAELKASYPLSVIEVGDI